MWVIFTKNYSGEHGFFCKDQKNGDIPDIIAKELISKKFCQKTCPPWEEQKDNRTIRLSILQEQQQIATTDLEKQNKHKADLLATIEERQKAADTFDKVKDEFGQLHKALCEKMIEADNIRVQLCDLNIAETNNALGGVLIQIDKLKGDKSNAKAKKTDSSNTKSKPKNTRKKKAGKKSKRQNGKTRKAKK